MKNKTTKLTTNSGYTELVKKIRAELSELDFFIRRRTAEGYWRIGKFIYEHLLEHKDKAEYGSSLYETLADELGKSKSTFQRAVQFFRTYPIVAEPRRLSWEHYKRLITVQDKAKRESFEKLALRREWTAEDLSEAIRLDRLTIDEPARHQNVGGQAKKLNTTRARLYTYQVLEPSYIHPVEEWLIIDLGFSMLIQSEFRGLRLRQGDLIESQKSGNTYSFIHSDAAKKELYTYKALVERVVDADTIWLNIDLGFVCWSRQKVRLRGIDAPELSTKKGLETKAFVEVRLKEVPFVIIKTHKSDKYDRYLADIFFLKAEEDGGKVLSHGTFLNQELLDMGLAKML